MRLGLTGDQITALIAVVTLVGGAFMSLIGYALHQKDAKQAGEIEAVRSKVSEESARVSAAWKAIDMLKDERHQYITRADHERWRAEIKADLEGLAQRVTRDMDRLIASLREELRGRPKDAP